METNIEVSGIIHDVFVNFDCFSESFLLDESQSDVSFDFELHLFVLVSCTVKRHIVHFYCLVVLLLLEKNVAHVDSKTTCLGVLLVFENDCIAVESLRVQTVCVVHVGQVVKNVKSQVDIDLIETAFRFSQLPNFFLL